MDQTHSIAIVGAGKIGSAFAFQLARAGHAVTVVARPGSDRLNQLQRHGCICNVKGEQAVVQISNELNVSIPYDLVIVTLLAHQVKAVMPALQKSAAHCIQFMFNTFQPEQLQEAVGLERCAFGMPFIQALIENDGRLKATIGAGGQKTIMSRQQWVDVFDAAGLPARLEPDMPLWLRCHAPLCAAFESVSCAGQRRQGGASWREALTIARGVHACYALLQTLGYATYPRSKQRIAKIPVWIISLLLWTMSRIKSLRDLLATGEAECNALLDAMLAAGSSRSSMLDLRSIEAMRPQRPSATAGD